MTLSKYEREHVDAIMGGHGDWFTAQLMRLIAKADSHHRALLRKGFPEEVELVERYLHGQIPRKATA
jgi:hypothetical protein